VYGLGCTLLFFVELGELGELVLYISAELEYLDEETFKKNRNPGAQLANKINAYYKYHRK